MEHSDCTYHGDGRCRGEVVMRSIDFQSVEPFCDSHWDKVLSVLSTRR